MVAATITKEHIMHLLGRVPDPEIPVVSIVDMGMVRDVEFTDGKCTITFTPTYMGCPAIKMIQDDIKTTLGNEGLDDVQFKISYSPAWTTDWMTTETKEKLRQYGIAPPQGISCHSMSHNKSTVDCPRCSSSATQIISKFGSTACKALYKCLDCKEPFEYFKCI
jgi:ring-1,2-phenylacetyl-CoA epoxidase subunit PaaD